MLPGLCSSCLVCSVNCRLIVLVPHLLLQSMQGTIVFATQSTLAGWSLEAAAHWRGSSVSLVSEGILEPCTWAPICPRVAVARAVP